MSVNIVIPYIDPVRLGFLVAKQNIIFHPYTPWKINMEPTNHPFRKENDLPNLHDYVPCDGMFGESSYSRVDHCFGAYPFYV